MDKKKKLTLVLWGLDYGDIDLQEGLVDIIKPRMGNVYNLLLDDMTWMDISHPTYYSLLSRSPL